MTFFTTFRKWVIRTLLTGGVLFFLALGLMAVPDFRGAVFSAVWREKSASPEEKTVADHPGEEDDHAAHHEEGEEEEAGAHHHHEGEENELIFSTFALENLGLGENPTLELKATDYPKQFILPGTVCDRPGRSLVNIPAPVAGIVTRIHWGEGQTLCPGESLFDIMLTHEEIVSGQSDLLTLLQQRDVLEMEAKRLETLQDGIAPKSKRDLTIQKMENDSAIAIQRNVLTILGIVPKMIEETIIGKREVITHITVRLPEIGVEEIEKQTENLHAGSDDRHDHFHVLEQLNVEKGDAVEIGDLLATVSDLRLLQIKGKAFASDEAFLNEAILRQSPVSAVFPSVNSGTPPETISGLRLGRLDNKIDDDTQSMNCYVELQNRLLGEDNKGPHEKHRLDWRFKPGQRCELRIDYDSIRDCYAVPTAAVAQRGGEAFVFVDSGLEEGRTVWLRREVRILYRARDAVVLAKTDDLTEGTKIAKAAAEQFQTAMESGTGALQSACPCGEH